MALTAKGKKKVRGLDWWNSLTDKQKIDYLNKHPKSKFSKHAPKKQPNSKTPTKKADSKKADKALNPKQEAIKKKYQTAIRRVNGVYANKVKRLRAYFLAKIQSTEDRDQKIKFRDQFYKFRETEKQRANQQIARLKRGEKIAIARASK